MRSFLFAVSLLCLTVACSEDPASTGETGGGGGTGGGSGGDGGMASGGGGAGGGCTPQAGVEPGPDWVCVTEVTGKVIDETDAPVDGMLMTVCGPGGCEPAATDSAGAFTVEVGFELLPDDFSLIPHGRDQGKLVFYFPLAEDEPGPVIDVGTVRVLDVPGGGETLTVKTDDAGEPAQNVTHGDVTLDVPAGVRINLDFDDVTLGAEGKLFRSRKVDQAFMDGYIDPSLSAVALYAMTPFDAYFDLAAMPGTPAKVTLSFANTTGLAANTPVEFLELGSFIVGTVEAGDWVVAATGAVSSDGTTIEMTPGEGITFLTWVAIREAS